MQVLIFLKYLQYRKSKFVFILKASKRGNIKVVELLVEAGADVNALALNGSTPLIVAALKGQKSIVQYLLAHNADVKVNDPLGPSKLSSA